MNTDSNSIAVSAGLRAALGYHRLVVEIGRGGMASVFLALFPNGDGTNRKMVLKQLHPDLALDDDFRAMFEDEARVATRLHHDNVVETYDIYADRERCVLVMEFLDGQTLSRVRQRARKIGNLPLSLHLRVIADVLAGLHYVHELTDHGGAPLGIVHRDVTPSNVFITYDGRVKLVDFGIAKATTRIAVTQMGVLKGKLAYMSPEAVRGEPVDRRSDIFSVGVMLWEAATGLRMWENHDDIAVLRRLVTGDLPLESANTERANPTLLRIAERALSVDPCHRYATAQQMGKELEKLLAKLGDAPRAPALGAYLQSSFAVEREKLQNIVDKAQARFAGQPVSQRRIAVERSGLHATLDPCEPPTMVSKPSGGTFRGATYDVALESNDLPDFRPRRRGFLLGTAAAVISLGVAVLAHAPAGVSQLWSGSSTDASPGTPAVAAPLGASPPASDPPALVVNGAGLASPPATANSAVANAAATTNPAPAVLGSAAASAASTARGSPVGPVVPAPKVRREKRAPDQDDRWGF
ncbi:MAG TPA: serine/threonine-protein kinase [Polyangiaceae bacterium]|nr:serine/threonine-protein kinase [Polyangiaceae bacterium]